MRSANRYRTSASGLPSASSSAWTGGVSRGSFGVLGCVSSRTGRAGESARATSAARGDPGVPGARKRMKLLVMKVDGDGGTTKAHDCGGEL